MFNIEKFYYFNFIQYQNLPIIKYFIREYNIKIWNGKIHNLLNNTIVTNVTMCCITISMLD